ncbi:hypothetical protein QF038_001651 [Pseudarthrobacter sp. W1I19]|uniref:hypothetical protein n=1 Tax=Pseudarthrobacter sp. W1I19 TaxID=3042288 RepID=UPI0027822970|nr:hypothetical protein [Pseudarthrobacter sp. W1I19]MDQ0923143.1 hypothetical protein [Pseudarthrobacter sp. W1I19]
MSQEQPPIRSRRELRKARDAQQASVSTGTDQVSPATKRPPAGRPAPSGAGTSAAGSPAPGSALASGTPNSPAPGAPSQAAEQTHTQRSSQIRARDRAALRTIKELEEKEGQLAAGGPPTRRQLRLQQLKEQALTAATPIVAPSGPAAPGANRPGSPASQVQADAAQDPKVATTPAPKSRSSTAPQGMTVEQALAARALLAEQAKNQIAKMEHIASLDPEAVDPEILAEQIALAERAAVINRRAMARQKLAEQAGVPVGQEALPGQEPEPTPESAPGKKPVPGQKPVPGRKPAPGQQKSPQQGLKAQPAADQRPAPSAASNLAMVTPLEFVQVPGVDRPVMKPPATSHVPVTTRPGTKVPPAAGTKKRRPAGGGRPTPSDSVTGRSQVIARAEAAARAASRPRPPVAPQAAANTGVEDAFEDLPRIPARSAHGLDPLDAATAGLARANRNRILQFCVLAFGILALIAGIVLIISGMSH